MKSIKNLFILLICLFLSQRSSSQTITAERLLKDSVSILNDSHWSKIKIGDINKKYIILDFWATWCKPCIDNHKNMESIYKLQSDSLSVVTIAINTCQEFSKFNRTWQTAMIKALDTAHNFPQKYNISIVPTMILINTENMNVDVISGALISNDSFKNFAARGSRKSYELPKQIDPKEVLNKFFKRSSTTTMVQEQNYIPNSGSFSLHQNPNENIATRRIYVNHSLAAIYKNCLKFTEVRSIYDYKEGPETSSCFELTVLDKDKNLIDADKYLISYLKKNHPGLKAQIISKLVDSCYFLEKVANGRLITSNEPVLKDNSSGNHISMKKVSLTNLCNNLEEQLRFPVDNRADTINLFDIELDFEERNVVDLNGQLYKIGLKLSLKKNVNIKYLVFKKETIHQKS